MRSAATVDSPNVFTSLTSRARAAADSALLSIEVAGFAVSLGILALAPRYAAFSLPGLAAGAFGLWGIIDHFIVANVLRFTHDRRRHLRLLQRAVGTGGVIAGLGSIYALFGLVEGTFIS